jgi:hypothetical protein
MQWNNKSRTREAHSLLARAANIARHHQPHSDAHARVDIARVPYRQYHPVNDFHRITEDSPLSVWQSVLAPHRGIHFQQWWIKRFAP